MKPKQFADVASLVVVAIVSTGCVDSRVSNSNSDGPLDACLTDADDAGSSLLPVPSAMTRQLKEVGLGNYEEAENCWQLRAQARILADFSLRNETNSATSSDSEEHETGEPYIFDGEIANQHELPVVRIGFITKEADKAFWCTGSIVSAQHILTAAHCPRISGVQRVIVQTWDISDFNIFEDARVEIHPEYEGKHQDAKNASHEAYDNDIALVSFKRNNRPSLMSNLGSRLRFQAKFGRQHPKQKLTRQKGSKLLIRGVGARNDDPTFPSVKGSADMPQGDQPITVNQVREGYLRARAKRKVRACQGDSGGPALFTKGARPVIWGVYSGFKLAEGQDPEETWCPKPGRQMYWAKTSNVHLWIENQMKVDSDYGFGPDFACKEYNNPAGSYYRCW